APSPVVAAWLNDRHSVDEKRATEMANRSGGSFEKAARLIGEEGAEMDLSDYDAESFFGLLDKTNWRRDGRKNAETPLGHLIELAQRRLHAGDVSQSTRLKAMLAARSQIDRHVPPRLVLENLLCNSNSTKKGGLSLNENVLSHNASLLCERCASHR